MKKNNVNHEEYEEVLAKERTLLSKERTKFSIERTLLSFVRTAFTIFLFAIALIKFFEFDKQVLWIGIICIFFGIGVLVIGLLRSIQANRKLKKID